MSLINEMLKDLEKRRSRDLETSESLSRNITWETRPQKYRFNPWQVATFAVVVLLLAVIVYLLWERNQVIVSAASVQSQQVQKPESVKTAPTPVVTTKKQDVVTAKTVKPKAVKPKAVKPAVTQPKAEAVTDAADMAMDGDDVVDAEQPVQKISKTQRPLNRKQQAEIAYQKGYRLLQQGRKHQGQEYLRKALDLYLPHVKAREVLAGSYIKSGRFVQAAALLKEGVKLSPEYTLFAKLYARVLLELDNPQLAIKVLQQGVANIRNEPDYFALLAATYQRVNAHQQAADLYLRLVKIRPRAGVWWLGLGISLEKLGKKAEALQAYQRATETGSLKPSLMKFARNRIAGLR